MDYYTILISSGLFACTYFFFFPEKVKEKFYSISWHGVKMYHKTNIYFKDLFSNKSGEKYNISSSEEESESESEEETNETCIFFDALKSQTSDLETNNVESLKISKNMELEDLNIESYDLLFLEHFEEERKYYKQINLDEDIGIYFDYELKKLPRQFLQIEVIYEDDEKYDIHEYISMYYVVGNVLFNPLFMNYYMKKWYNVDYDHNVINYKVNIIDKDIKLLNLEKDVYLILEDTHYKKSDA